MTTFAGHLLSGVHGSRPAATAVPAGTLYSCTTHALIYQSDGAIWATYATLGSTETLPASLLDAKGDLIAASADNTAGRLAVGSNDQVLVADSGQTLGVKWAAVPGTAAFVPVATVDAKGDLLVGTANDAVARLAVGTNNQVLTADSAQTTGVKWATAAAGSVASDAIWDTKGDLAVASAADTAAKLPVGSDGQVLTADAAQTLGVKWATAGGGGSSGVTKLFDATVTGADSATALDTGAGGIAAGYSKFEVVVFGRTDDASTNGSFYVRVNNDSSGVYDQHNYDATGTTVTATQNAGLTGWVCFIAGGSADANYPGMYHAFFPNYDGTVFYKTAQWRHGLTQATAGNSQQRVSTGAWRSTSAITRIGLTPQNAGKKFKIGSRMIVYGYA